MPQQPFRQVLCVHLLTCLTIYLASPKTNVMASTIVQIVTELAVSIEKIVMPCSRNKVRILSAKDEF